MLKVLTSSVYFWIVLGIVLSFLLALMQRDLIPTLERLHPQRMLSNTMIYSALRVLLSAGVLMLAFKSDVLNGLACLFAFIIARWFSLFLFLNKTSAGSARHQNKRKTSEGEAEEMKD